MLATSISGPLMDKTTYIYVTEIVVISTFRESGNAIIIIKVILDADEIIMLFSAEWLHILWLLNAMTRTLSNYTLLVYIEASQPPTKTFA